MNNGNSYSVVIPAFNSELTLLRALVSVRRQTLIPLEVIVIDDHSSDGTEGVARQHEALFLARAIGFKYIRLRANAGPSFARNTGMRLAGGTYVAFLDADDEWATAKLEILDHVIASQMPDLICHAYTENLCTDDSFDKLAPTSWHHKYRALPMWRLLLRNPAQTSCTVIRRSPQFLFDEDMRYCEDYDLWVRLADGGSAIQMMCPPLTRLGRPQLSVGGLSGNRVLMRLGEARVYRNFCRQRWIPRALLLPALLLLSLLKHGVSMVRR